ncbi:MAG: hypothetical protein WB952_12005 [Terriglobales bacterium]
MSLLLKICGDEIRIRGRLIRIARPEADKYQTLDDPESLVYSLRHCGERIDLFTFMQIMPETSPKYHFPMEWDNLAVLPVSTYDHWWTKQIRSLARNRARQAEKKGVALREVSFDDVLAQGIWRIYNESPIRQGRPFPHYGKDIETVRREAATFLDNSLFIGAFLGSDMIGFVKLTWDKACTQANLMNILAMIKHRDTAPTNALIAQAVRSCASRGIRYLVYQQFHYGKKRNDTLSHFKEINGFERVDLPRYYIPLTRLGGAAFKLGLHLRFADHLPEPVVAKIRQLRNSWFGRKVQVGTEAS